MREPAQVQQLLERLEVHQCPHQRPLQAQEQSQSHLQPPSLPSPPPQQQQPALKPAPTPTLQPTGNGPAFGNVQTAILQHLAAVQAAGRPLASSSELYTHASQAAGVSRRTFQRVLARLREEQKILVHDVTKTQGGLVLCGTPASRREWLASPQRRVREAPAENAAAGAILDILQQAAAAQGAASQAMPLGQLQQQVMQKAGVSERTFRRARALLEERGCVLRAAVLYEAVRDGQ